MIAAAVRRAGMEHALPRLNETHTIRVALPLYQIRLLHWLAVTRSEPGKPELTVSDVLEHDVSMMLVSDAWSAAQRPRFPTSVRRRSSRSRASRRSAAKHRASTAVEQSLPDATPARRALHDMALPRNTDRIARIVALAVCPCAKAV